VILPASAAWIAVGSRQTAIAAKASGLTAPGKQVNCA
jgi:hypothetical protein